MTDELEYGPAMAALTEKQRRFVLAMASDPFGSAAAWARAAGYSDKSEGAKVYGHYLLYSPKIEEAVLEVGRSMMTTVGPVLAAHAMLRAAANPRHPKHLRAAEMLANRVGLHEVQEVRVRRTDETIAAKLERLRELAALLGVDAAALIGANAPHVKQIEAQAEPAEKPVD